MPEEIPDKRRTGEAPVSYYKDKTYKPPPISREFKRGVIASFFTSALVCLGGYFILPRHEIFQDKGNGYAVSYQKSGKNVSLSLKLEEALKNEAAKLSGLAIRVQETGQTAPLTQKDNTYVAALTLSEAYTLLVVGKDADGKEISLRSFRFPPAK